MSFYNLSTYNNIKKLNLALLVLVTFLALATATFLPFISFLGLAVLPIPAALLILSGRKRDSIICTILGIAPLFFFDYVLAIVIISLITAISFVYKIYVDRNRSVSFAVSNVFLAFLGIVMLYILVISVLGRVNFVNEFLKSYNGYIDNLPNDLIMKKYISIMGMDEAQFNSVLKQSQNFLRFIPYLFPGIWVVYCMSSSVINYFISYTVFKKQGINIKPFVSFKKWDIAWYWCWGIIIGLVLILLPHFNPTMDVLIDVVGFNLLIIFGLLYSVLGVSVIWGIFDRFKVSIMWRTFFFILFGLFIGFIIILPIIGLVDVWVNFRKLKRG